MWYAQRDLPYELDATLRTLGTTDLGGSINTPKKFFGAHHRIVPGLDGGRRLVGFNFSEEPSGGLLNFFEYDEQFRLLYKTTRLLKVCTLSRCNAQCHILNIAPCFMYVLKYSDKGFANSDAKVLWIFISIQVA